MQICKNCKSEQLDGAIFCSECGASLSQEREGKGTTSTLGQHGNEFVPLPDQATVVPAPDIRTTDHVVSLVVLNSGRRLRLEDGKDLLIGRATRDGEYPDIDLGRDGGYDAGVSRRHAMISIRDGVCMLTDLSSSNGTFVNGRRLSPHQPVALRNGDELKFGTLLLRVEFTS